MIWSKINIQILIDSNIFRKLHDEMQKKKILKCELACAEMKEKNWMDKKIKKMKIIEENKLSADEKKLHRL